MTQSMPMTRPEWLKTEAHIFFGEVSEAAFAYTETQIREEIERGSAPHFTRKLEEGSSDIFDCLYTLGHYATQHTLQAPIHHKFTMLRLPETLMEGVIEYTFGGNATKPYANFIEAYQTMWTAPINLLQEAQEAGAQVDTLQDVVEWYRKPSFRKVLGRCALTANGFWQSWANRPTSGIGFRYGDGGPFVRIDDDGELHLEKTVASRLTEHLKETNSMGIPSKESSGCPVRHRKAKYEVSNPQHVQSLKYMAQMFGKTPNELLEKRSDSPIDRMLEVEARVIEAIDAREASPYLVSSRISF